jgi:hypothetical protein
MTQEFDALGQTQEQQKVFKERVETIKNQLKNLTLNEVKRTLKNVKFEIKETLILT